MIRKRIPPKDRFFAIIGNRSLDECWSWPTGKRGKFWIGDGYVMAYRFSYEIHYGKPIPSDLMGCHSCDNEACVNPTHISPGTCKDNMADAAKKGRMSSGPSHSGFQPKGSRVYCAVLTEAEVVTARARYKPRHPTEGIRAMAREFGVSHAAMGYAVRGENWKSVTHDLPN